MIIEMIFFQEFFRRKCFFFWRKEKARRLLDICADENVKDCNFWYQKLMINKLAKKVVNKKKEKKEIINDRQDTKQ